jgi:hypothetical protein
MNEIGPFACPNGHPVATDVERPCHHCGAVVMYEPQAVGIDLHRQLQEREAIWLERLRQADQRYGAELARHIETHRRARDVSEALAIVAQTEQVTSEQLREATTRELSQAHGIIRELIQFIPYEKPEQGPLPDWIVDVAERAYKAAGLHD